MVRRPAYRNKCLNAKGEECTICESTRDIEVHHVDGNPVNNDLENLIPVCGNCHKDIHNGELRSWYEKLGASSHFSLTESQNEEMAKFHGLQTDFFDVEDLIDDLIESAIRGKYSERITIDESHLQSLVENGFLSVGDTLIEVESGESELFE